MRVLKFPAIVLTLALILGASLWLSGGPRLALAQTGQLSPVATSGAIVPLTNSVAQIVGTNPSRHSIRICNTGATNALWVWPGPLATVVSDYVLAPIASNVITCYTPPAGLVAGDAGARGIGNSWNGHAIGTIGTTFSVEEW